MKQVDLHGLPPCPLSIQCLRLLDDLDEPGVTEKPAQVSFSEDLQDERLLYQLRIHVPNCLTCTAVLSQARRIRSQQRAALRDLLSESEASLPSTTSQILAAIHREQKDVSRPDAAKKRASYYLQELTVMPGPQILNGKHNHLIEPRPMVPIHIWLRNVLALATVAAVILFATGIFDHFVNRQVPSGHTPLRASMDSRGWDSVVIGLTLTAPGIAKLMGIYNYNPVNKQHDDLMPPSRVPANVHIDRVSQDGLNVLYQFSNRGHTLYATLKPVRNTGYFYELADSEAGNAIWMDNDYALIAIVNNGIAQVNIHTGISTHLFPGLKIIRLTFYRAPYIYFIGAAGVGTTALYRVNIKSPGESSQMVTMSIAGTGSSYLLSPDGTKVFFAGGEHFSMPYIQSISSDGTIPARVLGGEITPIGYAKPVGFADDNSLMIMRVNNGKFQVIKVETTLARGRVVVNDAAPDATSLCDPGIAAIICDNNIAFAPYGYGMVVNAFYTGGAHKVWYYNLIKGTRSLLLTLDNSTLVQLPGWDRIPVTSE